MTIAALLALHGVLAVVAALAGPRVGRRILILSALAPAATVAWLATRAPGVLRGLPVEESVTWVPPLGLELAFRVDAFSLLMAGLVSGIGVLIFAYAFSYFGDRLGLGRLAALLGAFAAAMLGLVTTDNLLAVYVFWELTAVTSYLLIGFDHENEGARAAALKALLVTGGGGLAMLAGFVLLGLAAGTFSLSGIVAAPPSGPLVGPAALLVLAGAFTKSAQFPFHSWLPAAMAAPTPVSAYLHSATMVKAGVYLVARLAPALAAVLTFWRPLVVSVGLVTMVVGGYRALQEYDLKALLAYGTISQLGMMTALIGAGDADLTFAGTAVLLAHALFKAALFMVAGCVHHQAHTLDLRKLSGLGRAMPWAAGVAFVSAASMAGLPPLFGFVAKEQAYEALLHGVRGAADVAAVGAVVGGSALTVAYGARFLWGAFAVKPSDGGGAVGAVDPPSVPLLAPAALLALLTVAFGLLPRPAGTLVGKAAAALDADAEGAKLALWHGLTLALALSVAAVATGAAVFIWIRRREGAGGMLPRLGVPVYPAAVRGLDRVARLITGVVQNGSLPLYLAVILLTVVTLPGAVLAGSRLPSGLRLFDTPLQLPVALVVVSAAVGVVFSRRRFAAVLFLGGVGYGVAVLFLIQGAPDLAITQLLIETLTVVVFVLVLRHLPERFPDPAPAVGIGLRAAVAGSVGVFVATFALIAAGARTAPPVSEAHVEQAVPRGGGRNVVNVILVDIRGFDTLGEVAVLTVAALGIASLVTASRRGEGDPDAPPPASSDGGADRPPGRPLSEAGPEAGRRPA